MEVVQKPDQKPEKVVEHDFGIKKIMEYKDNQEYEKYIYYLKEYEEKNPSEVNILLADHYIMERKTRVDNAEGLKSAKKLIKMGVKEGWFFMGYSLLRGKGQQQNVPKGRKYIKTYLEKLEKENENTGRDKDYELLARLQLARELFVWRKSKLSDLMEALSNYEYCRDRDYDCFTEMNELGKKIYNVKKARKKKIVRTVVFVILALAAVFAVYYLKTYQGIDVWENLKEVFGLIKNKEL